MRTIYSTIRLLVGCCLLFCGINLLNAPSKWADASWFGVIAGGVGLTIALHELAYVHARFVRYME